MAKPEGHGRDHRWGGMDETPPSRWMYVTPVSPADDPSTYDGEYDASDGDYPAFVSPWGNIASYLPFAFRYNAGGIELRGACTGGEVTAGSTITTIPSTYPRPVEAQRHFVQVGADGSGIGTVEIATTGVVTWVGEVVGAAGADGINGVDGVGVPAGGSTGQALEKASSADYDTVWATIHEVPSGGTSGQALVKNSSTNYDTSWGTVSGGSGWHDGSGVPSSGLGANGDYYIDDDSGDIYLKAAGAWSKVAPGARISDLLVNVDNFGSVIATGVKGDIELDFAGQILQWTLLADQSGSIQIDLWKAAYSSYPPTVGNTITASAKPLISSATKAQSATLTGWTTTFSAGDVLRVNVDSVATVTRVMLALKVKRT